MCIVYLNILFVFYLHLFHVLILLLFIYLLNLFINYFTESIFLVKPLCILKFRQKHILNTKLSWINIYAYFFFYCIDHLTEMWDLIFTHAHKDYGELIYCWQQFFHMLFRLYAHKYTLPYGKRERAILVHPVPYFNIHKWNIRTRWPKTDMHLPCWLSV